MKNNALYALMTVLVLFMAPAHGQEDQPSQSEEFGEQSRPTMPRLFFTNQQRRILEVVRQEYITEEVLEQQEFVPLVLAQQEAVEEVDELAFTRENNFRINAFVRNRKTGSGIVWLNNARYELGDNTGILFREEGLSELMPDAATDGSITGVDTYNNSRFVLKVGQSLATDGEVNEVYPVVIVKKK